MAPQPLAPEAGWLLPVHPPPSAEGLWRFLPGGLRSILPPIRRSLSIPPTSSCTKAKSAFFPELSQDSNLGLDSTAGSRTPAAEAGWGGGVTRKAQGPEPAVLDPGWTELAFLRPQSTSAGEGFSN